eukprot:Awhi_evm1s4543
METFEEKKEFWIDASILEPEKKTSFRFKRVIKNEEPSEFLVGHDCENLEEPD